MVLAVLVVQEVPEVLAVQEVEGGQEGLTAEDMDRAVMAQKTVTVRI